MEISFGIITRQAIRRGTFRFVQELTAAIGTYNDCCRPFTWTNADQFIEKIKPSKNQSHATLAVVGRCLPVPAGQLRVAPCTPWHDPVMGEAAGDRPVSRLGGRIGYDAQSLPPV
jgi:hypothetical protein